MLFLQMSAANYADAENFIAGISGNPRPATGRPGGESFVDQIARADAGLAPLPAGDVVLVVHSGTIRAALAIAPDLDPDGALRFVVDPLSVTRIDRLESGWQVVAVNQR
jgi:alpha-ribazole phosphatase